MDKAKILIIEDDEDIREGIRILLESEGFVVNKAESGEIGLKILSEDTGLVILDIMMPGMSGLRFSIISIPIFFVFFRYFQKFMQL